MFASPSQAPRKDIPRLTLTKWDLVPNQYSCNNVTLTFSPAWWCSLDMYLGLNPISLPCSIFPGKPVTSCLLYLYLLYCSPDEHVNLFQLSAKPELFPSSLSCPFLTPSAAKSSSLTVVFLCLEARKELKPTSKHPLCKFLH